MEIVYGNVSSQTTDSPVMTCLDSRVESSGQYNRKSNSLHTLEKCKRNNMVLDWIQVEGKCFLSNPKRRIVLRIGPSRD